MAAININFNYFLIHYQLLDRGPMVPDNRKMQLDVGGDSRNVSVLIAVLLVLICVLLLLTHVQLVRAWGVGEWRLPYACTLVIWSLPPSACDYQQGPSDNATFLLPCVWFYPCSGCWSHSHTMSPVLDWSCSLPSDCDAFHSAQQHILVRLPGLKVST